MRTKQGVITSASMQNTVTVTVHRAVLHPLYSKRFRVSKKFLADTNGHDLGVGDEVVITECRPLSKRKRFKVTDVIKQAARTDAMTDDLDPSIQRDHRDRDAKKEDSSSPS